MQRSLTYSSFPSMLETTDTSALRHLLPIIRTSPHSHPPTPKRLLGLAGSVDNSPSRALAAALPFCREDLHDSEGRGTEGLGPVSPLNHSGWKLGVGLCEVSKEVQVGPKGPHSLGRANGRYREGRPFQGSLPRGGLKKGSHAWSRQGSPSISIPPPTARVTPATRPPGGAGRAEGQEVGGEGRSGAQEGKRMGSTWAVKLRQIVRPEAVKWFEVVQNWWRQRTTLLLSQHFPASPGLTPQPDARGP